MYKFVQISYETWRVTPTNSQNVQCICTAAIVTNNITWHVRKHVSQKEEKMLIALQSLFYIFSRLSKYTPKKSTFTEWIAPCTKARMWRWPRLCSIQEWNGRLVFNLTSFGFFFKLPAEQNVPLYFFLCLKHQIMNIMTTEMKNTLGSWNWRVQNTEFAISRVWHAWE